MNVAKILLLMLVFIGAMPDVFANSLRSAQFYLNTPEKYEGKEIVLYTAFVKRQRAAHEAEKIFFYAYTMSRDDRDTAYIIVMVAKDKADQFARRYGSDFFYNGSRVRKLPMAGVFRQADDNWYLEYDAKP